MYSPGPPLISICVPTLRGYEQLGRLLTSIEQHSSHLDYEVVIIDSGSRIRGYTAPMNQALDAARGEYVVAINDDVQVTAGWLDPLLDEATTGTPVCFPDQTSTDGFQCITGWCVMFRADFLREWGGYDGQYVLWCSDIDLCRYLDEINMPPKRVAIPVPLIHELGATQTRPGVHGHLDREAVADLDRYQAKWGTSALEDKHSLAR